MFTLTSPHNMIKYFKNCQMTTFGEVLAQFEIQLFQELNVVDTT